MDELTRELFPRFQAVPLLSQLEDRLLESVAEECQVMAIQPNNLIVSEGDFDEAVYVVLGGLVRVTKRLPSGEEKYVASLGVNEFFGEQSALSGVARAASASAETQTYLLKIDREKFLDLMKKSKRFKAYVDAVYLDRALWGHLRLIPAFAALPDQVLNELAEIAKLETYARNAVMATEGEPATKVFLIRQGYMKVSVFRRGRDEVFAYLRDNNYFGEEALYGNQRYAGTVTALSPTEAIVIGREDFDRVRSAHPELTAAIQSFAEDKLREAQEEQQVGVQDEIMVQKGFVATRSLLVLDTRKCIRCEICVRSCAATHQGNSRIHLTGYTVENWLLPTACFQCRDPECQLACRFGCITRNLNGQIFINEGLCTGCTACAKACPYDSIIMTSPPEPQKHGLFARFFARLLGRDLASDRLDEWREESRQRGATEEQIERGVKAKSKATKCDLCVGYGFTSCVYNCPTGALDRVNPELFLSERATSGNV